MICREHIYLNAHMYDERELEGSRKKKFNAILRRKERTKEHKSSIDARSED